MSIVYYDNCEACAQWKCLNDPNTDLEAANPSVIQHTCPRKQETKGSKTMEALPILYSKGKNAYLIWRVWVEGAVVIQEFGQMGGKQQQSRREARGKNIGRSNETTPEMQAELEAKAVWTKKSTRKYAESIEALNNRPLLPMLAKNDK